MTGPRSVGGFWEDRGGKIIAPNGQLVATIHVENMTSSEANTAAEAVLAALAKAFEVSE